MTRRLTRAKSEDRRRAASRTGCRPARPSTERLPGVLAVLYLLFTQGYDADGEPAFADEAIRLARLLAGSCRSSLRRRRCWRSSCCSTPGATPAATPTATWCRSTGRTAPAGTRPRSPRVWRCWPGSSRTARTGCRRAIAACHATAPSAAGTDWPTIAALLRRRWPGCSRRPVIELNRAVAHGYAHGPAAGLALLAAARAGGALDDYPLAIAAEADLTARAATATAPRPCSGRRPARAQRARTPCAARTRGRYFAVFGGTGVVTSVAV